MLLSVLILRLLRLLVVVVAASSVVFLFLSGAEKPPCCRPAKGGKGFYFILYEASFSLSLRGFFQPLIVAPASPVKQSEPTLKGPAPVSPSYPTLLPRVRSGLSGVYPTSTTGALRSFRGMIIYIMSDLPLCFKVVLEIHSGFPAQPHTHKGKFIELENPQIWA